jgi:hypothetical protein
MINNLIEGQKKIKIENIHKKFKNQYIMKLEFQKITILK